MAPGYGALQVIGADHRRRQACFDDYLRIAKLVQASAPLHINGNILAQPADLDPDLASFAMFFGSTYALWH
jgi:trimethylamine:corrinoid methyltransferase-like protein